MAKNIQNWMRPRGRICWLGAKVRKAKYACNCSVFVTTQRSVVVRYVWWRSEWIKGEAKACRAIQLVTSGEKQVDVARRFKVEQCTVSAILKRKESITAEWERGCGNRKALKQPKSLTLDSAFGDSSTQKRKVKKPLDSDDEGYGRPITCSKCL